MEIEIKKRYLRHLLLKYLLFILILKNIHYLLGFSLNDFNSVAIIYLPLAYLAVKYLFYNELEKNKLNRKDYFLYIVIGYSALNIIFLLNPIYIISVLIFLFLLKNRKTKEEDIINKNIKEYYQDK